ncbi:MAG: dTDP-4-dehydrorhamnose 3,5-epimerase [Cytophagales bacterium]|jgi:dTDP-4-dehydrorhamnose 3,5-epimerase|nr:dTDP-4-dehydrorhamnose 3,5-epimerase [Cytophagales bacterium]
MQFKPTSIAGLIEIVPRIFEDERGFFLETYQYKIFAANGIPDQFVQDNQSFSTKGVLRGLHFQRPPFAQGKLVRVVSGRALDVAVDLRENSPTFGQHVAVVLDSLSGNMLFVPEGFAHGFLALEDTVLQYKCTNVYDKASEGGLAWNDPQLNIDWGIKSPLVSEKDLSLPTLEELLKTSD